MKKAHLKIVLVTIFAALLSGCTWLNTETEGGISRGKLIVGMVAFGAGIAGIVHSDSDSGDTILPTRPTTGGGDTLPEVGIATSDSVMEGGAVVLTITSSIAPPTNPLTVTVNIGVANMDEFESDGCTGTVCFVVIAATEMTAELTLTALSGDESENVEMWTATIMPASAIFSIDAANDDDTFAITNLLLPVRANNLMRSALDDYDLPTALAANQIRAGGDDDSRVPSRATLPITGFQYNDADGNPQVFVQQAEFAHIGIWINGALADNDFDYAWLGDNVVTPPATTDLRGTATYDIEGDATYRGINFFPDGTLTMNFNAGTFRGLILANTVLTQAGENQVDDDFGGILPGGNFAGFSINFGGDITDDGFEATNINILADGGTLADGGSFSDLNGMRGNMVGRFHDAAGYDPTMATPAELSGVFGTNIGGGADELKMGFLGRRP